MGSHTYENADPATELRSRPPGSAAGVSDDPDSEAHPLLLVVVWVPQSVRIKHRRSQTVVGGDVTDTWKQQRERTRTPHLDYAFGRTVP